MSYQLYCRQHTYIEERWAMLYQIHQMSEAQR